ncbi:MAG: Sec-independent protein translocase protein TatB [Actinomycetota bacterium]
MPQIGPMEILVVGVLALIVFGPDKLPEIARTVGGFIKQMRAMADDVKQEFSDFDVEDEPDDEELAAIAGNDSEVARLEDEEAPEPQVPAGEDSAAEEEGTGAQDHPVAGAIEADGEASRRAEGA